MRRNKLMLISGLSMVVGSTFIFPFIGLVASMALGEDGIEKLINSDSAAGPLLAVIGIAVGVMVPIIGTFLIIGSVLIPYLSNRRAKNRIISQGNAAEAKILALADTGTRINNDPLVTFSLEVYSMTQPPFRTEVRETVSVIHLPSYQPGKIINVRYLPGTNEVAIIAANTF